VQYYRPVVGRLSSLGRRRQQQQQQQQQQQGINDVLIISNRRQEQTYYGRVDGLSGFEPSDFDWFPASGYKQQLQSYE